MWVRVGWLNLLFWMSLTSGADIYRCQAGDGKVRFTDHACKSTELETIVLMPFLRQDDVGESGFSQVELRRLDALDQKLAESRKLAVKQRRRNARRAAVGRDARRKNCSRAKAGLALIREKKRYGYKLSDSRKLDHEVTAYTTLKEQNC